MRVVTETEAKELVCPYMPLSKNQEIQYCLASSCMSWQSYSIGSLGELLRFGLKSKPTGFCDYNGFATPVVLGTVGYKTKKD